MSRRKSQPRGPFWEPALSDAGSAKLRAIVERELGFQMPPSKDVMLKARIAKRVRQLGFSSIDSYCEQLLAPPGGSDELLHLLDLVTTNVTSFFREPEQLAWIRVQLAELAKRARVEKREIRAWSAACSRGHEAWTLAMMLAELGPECAFSVVGSDVSGRVLEEARRAVYPETELESVPAALRSRYFLRSRDRDRQLVRVVPELRQRVRFLRLNLMASSFDMPRDFDLVLLRNVLIYFAGPTQAEVAGKVASHLRPEGLLCIALSESLRGQSLPLTHLKLGVYRYLGGGRVPPAAGDRR